MNLIAPITGWAAKFLKGAAAAAVGGIFTAIGVAWADPKVICFTSDCLALLGKQVLVGAVLAVGAYFKTPHRDADTRTREEDAGPGLTDISSGVQGPVTDYK